MKTRKEMIREYKERAKPAGIFQIKNTVNGKILLGSSLNLEGPLNSHRFLLTTGTHKNKALQKDWDTYGQEAFVFEILDTVTVKDEPGFDVSGELALLEEIWSEKLDPFDDRGYNESRNIRKA